MECFWAKFFPRQDKFWHLLLSKSSKESRIQHKLSVLRFYQSARPASDVKWVILHSHQWMLAKWYQNSSYSKILLPVTNYSVVFLFARRISSHSSPMPLAVYCNSILRIWISLTSILAGNTFSYLLSGRGQDREVADFFFFFFLVYTVSCHSE